MGVQRRKNRLVTQVFQLLEQQRELFQRHGNHDAKHLILTRSSKYKAVVTNEHQLLLDYQVLQQVQWLVICGQKTCEMTEPYNKSLYLLENNCDMFSIRMRCPHLVGLHSTLHSEAAGITKCIVCISDGIGKVFSGNVLLRRSVIVSRTSRTEIHNRKVKSINMTTLIDKCDDFMK